MATYRSFFFSKLNAIFIGMDDKINPTILKRKEVFSAS